MGLLNLADWVECTEVEGPGKRFALWVQGCILKCPGCCNPQMFDLAPRHLLETQQVVDQIARALAHHGIEGVTFLGGEPMLQARGLAVVAKAVRTFNLSVMVFSGYRLEELQQMAMPGVSDLLSVTDILVDGPFVAGLPERERNWAGSTNQRFHFLTDRYRAGIERDAAFGHGFEVRIGPTSELELNGWPVDVEHLDDKAKDNRDRTADPGQGNVSRPGPSMN